MKQVLVVVGIIFASFSNVWTMQLVQSDVDNLLRVKQSIKNGTAADETLKAYQNLLFKADSLLSMRNHSVMDKISIPPSNDKHDYMSLSRYWWPNLATTDSLPWIRKDGITNSDTQTEFVDRKNFGEVCSSIYYLSLAYYFSGNEAYAIKSIGLIDTWFLNEATKMNPNLEFAQSVPGLSKGRRSGILDGRIISYYVLDSMVLLSSSDNWTSSIENKMNSWLTDYLTWLTTSKIGMAGATQENNHGSWYKFQVAAIALYLGNVDLANEMVDLAKKSLNSQLDKDGRQVFELERTKSFSYSCFNLEALSRIAIVGDKIGNDLWNYESSQKKSLKLAIDYLLPVVNGAEWSYPTFGIDLSKMVRLLSYYSAQTENEEYLLALNKIVLEMSLNDSLTFRQQVIYNEYCLLLKK
jgi:hypothetical protein